MAAGVFGIARTTAESLSDRLTCSNRKEHGAARNGGRTLWQHACELCRFDGEHDDVGSRRNSGGVLVYGDAECRSDGACTWGRIDDLDAARCATVGEPTPHERLAHVAEPEQKDLLVGAQRPTPCPIRAAS